jgi:pimeloyl-ACP methyl ester carboxylesterase
MSGDIHKGYADIAAGQIQYRYVAGPGTPLVFFHRNPASSAAFIPVLEYMAGDRPLYAFDTPGFGGSFDPLEQPSIADYAAWMTSAIDALGIDEMHLFGHHTGTHFASQMAIDVPGRVKSVMLNGITYWDEAVRQEFKSKLPEPADFDPDGQYVVDTWKGVSGMFETYDPQLVHLEFLSCLRAFTGRHQATSAVLETDYPALFAEIPCPIFVMCAEDETLRPWFQDALDARPDARSAILGPARYFSPELDTARMVGEIRAFLADVEA